MRLSAASLARLPATVAGPAYAPTATRIGVVHLGMGAFHRAHQAFYLDQVLAREPDWAVCGVSLRTAEARDALAPQDGLYTLELLGEPAQRRVIGALREVLYAPEQGEAVLARLARPETRLVTLTVTEKGYCLDGETLELAHPDIVRDLATPDTPASAIGYLVAGLRRRRAAGLPPYTVLSCDNLPDNGGKLRRACLRYARQFDPGLGDWIEDRASFPRSMVDSITPASDAALRERVAEALGLEDAAPVQREPYAQWVVEEDFCNGRPDWERVGVTMSDDIAGYDRAKLRLLNAPHSALAYLGLLLGLDSVAEAMRHPWLGPYIARLMRAQILPNLRLPRGLDAEAYTEAILARFANPAVRHRLAQIAQDGSQKLPVRWLGTIADALAAGRDIDALCLPVAAWLHYIRRQAQAGAVLADPLVPVLTRLGCMATGEAAHDVPAMLLGLDAVFAPLREQPGFAAALQRAYAVLGDGSAACVERALASGP